MTPVAPEAGAQPTAGPSIDLRPRPLASRPLVMNLNPTPGQGGLPEGQETGFANLTVHHPEAWRYSLFFRRAVENMDGVFRYELGAPFPYSLRVFALANPRVGQVCSYTAVELDGAGKLLGARVQKSSGLPEVDQLIVEVIRRTAPFANLPPGLADERGIYADSWGLCLVWGRG
jgi:TonB family protein